MSKRRNRHQQVATTDPAREGELLVKGEGGQSMAFTFGDPTPMLDGRDLLDYLECWANGRWYEPPVSLDGLAKASKAGVYLPSGLIFKRNALARSRDDQLAMLRIPPQLMGVVPQNAGGFGSVREAAQVWAINELEPEQARLRQINEWLGEEVIRFNPYELPAPGP